MYRASLKADAPIVIVSLFPDGACAFAYRRHDGERITQKDILPVGKARALRLTRNGAHFEVAALDADGQVFATESADLPELASSDGHAGFFVLSHESTLLSKAAFTDVKFR
jgi:hypothetical protein